MHVVITDRDRRVFGQIFENRVMSLSQIHSNIFAGRSRQFASRRLGDLHKGGFLTRQRVDGIRGSALSVFCNKPTAIRELADTYRFSITNPICKSDSIKHDLALIALRRHFEGLKTVTEYFTENMLQSCRRFSESEDHKSYVLNNSDAALEVTRGNKKLMVGLEFESSEKAQDRYIRKLVNYYSDGHTPVVLYVCETPRIKMAVAQAEAAVIANRAPRCHYALYEDVLGSSCRSTFTDLKGASIMLA